MPSSARNTALPSKLASGVNSVRYHHDPSAIDAGAWLKVSPMNGSGYTLFSTSAANTVAGTVVAYQPVVLAPGCESSAPVLPFVLLELWIDQPSRRNVFPASQSE